MQTTGLGGLVVAKKRKREGMEVSVFVVGTEKEGRRKGGG